MSDDILSRARLLAKAANEVADQMSSQVDEYKAIINARKADEAKNMEIENEKRKNEEKSRNISLSDVGNQKVFNNILSFILKCYLVCQRCGNLWFCTCDNIRGYSTIRTKVAFLSE